MLIKHAAVKKVEIKHRQCSFVDEPLKQHMSHRDQLLKIARETNSPQDWQIYRAKRNDLVRFVYVKPRENMSNKNYSFARRIVPNGR